MTVKNLIDVIDDAWIEVYDTETTKLLFADWEDENSYKEKYNKVKDKTVKTLRAYEPLPSYSYFKGKFEKQDIVFYIYI